MARTWLLTLLWGVFIQVHGVPWQLPDFNGFKVQGAKPPPPPQGVFDTFERMNKASKKNLLFGDIVVKDGRSALNCPSGNCFWPKVNGWVTIPYIVDSKFTSDERDLITLSMLEFSGTTCVRFVPRTTQADYLSIISDIGCWSSLGRDGGLQEVSLDREGCMIRGIIQHELNHALGFVHEHSRSDRDSYIKILWQNILSGYSDNFEKLNTNNLGMPYDYSSVMHYDKYAFTTAYYLQTIQPLLNTSERIGQRLGLSNLDVAKINKLYNCNVCSNVVATDYSGVLLSPSYPSNYPNNYNCSWLLRIPINKILLEFNVFDVQSSANCSTDYMRIYDGPSRASPMLLDKTCGSGRLPALVSSGTVLLVELVTDSSVTTTGFNATFRKVTCGGTYTAPTGSFTSPGYGGGQLYPPFSNCSWLFLAPAGYRFPSFAVL
ncbi:hatching enzyme 1.2-like [Dendropsophus ebraccatus]|uniref:hatching enzyme 1.2-like n=1 Tax=Dendropsophus ebraccatus TaxID=150705 RepID=UPI003831E48A